MRRSLLLPVLTLVVALAALPGPAARADVTVSSGLVGPQHSPSVAITPFQVYVVTFSREDTSAGLHYLRLAHASLVDFTFQNIAVPPLPPNWLWRPNGAISYEPGSGKLWLAGMARLVDPDSAWVGLFVTAGTPQPDGSVIWAPAVRLWSYPASEVHVPGVALATGDGSASAFVLHNDGYGAPPGTVSLYRISENLTTVTAQALASNAPGVDAYATPTLTAGPGGMVVAGWKEIAPSPNDDPAAFVTRTSHDGGATFGPEELVADISSSLPDGPGAVGFMEQSPTLLIAKYADSYTDTRLAFWASSYAFSTQFDPSTIFLTTDCCGGGAWNPNFGSTVDRPFGSYEVLPAVTMADDGYFYLGWHDFAYFDPDSVSQFMVARLWNMGFSASPPTELAYAPFDWDNVDPDTYGLGWQSGVAAAGGRVVFAWGDRRGVDADVYAGLFRAGGFVQSLCNGDTVDVLAGQQAQLTWRIENHNELFADEYAYGASGTRSWTNGLDLDTVVVAPDYSLDVSFAIDVPDTAASGLIPMWAYTSDHVRAKSCPKFLRVTSLVDAGSGGAGGAVALSAPRPNPSARGTSFAFTLPAAADVDLAIYDLRGRHVATLARGAFAPGAHAARWDAARAAPGIYFARLSARAGGAVTTREQRVVVTR